MLTEEQQRLILQFLFLSGGAFAGLYVGGMLHNYMEQKHSTEWIARISTLVTGLGVGIGLGTMFPKLTKDMAKDVLPE